MELTILSSQAPNNLSTISLPSLKLWRLRLKKDK